MALQLSALLSRFRAPVCRVRAAGVKFTHTSAPGSPHRATGPPRGHIKASLRAEKFSAAAEAAGCKSGSSSPPGRRAWWGKVALGAALGVSALVQSLHTGSVAAMDLKFNLSSGQGDWKETKDHLLSLSVKDRRQYYKTSGYVPLDDIPVWTPTADPSKEPLYKRNEKLDRKISLYSGDITKLEIDAIVNAANNSLLGGGGVDGAIHRAAGPMLKEECASLNGCETGEAKITCGYGLPAKYVIHTVGPIAHGGVGEKEQKALRSCYRKSLEAATKSDARSVAFPCISTGIYGYPPDKAAKEALATVREYLEEHHDKLDRVIFCVFMETDKALYQNNLPHYFPAAPTEATVKSKL